MTVLWASLLLVNAAPATLTPFGANWRYLDNGTDPGTNWSQRSFNDSTWSTGPAQLGYSSNPQELDEATVVGFGPNANDKYITTYFRHTFTVTNPAEFTSLTARLLVDDGAVVYLNGQEAFRTNMPAGIVTNRTLAVSALENALFTNSISPSMLVAGTNVLAVEVHQNTGASTDLSFDLELTAQPLAPGNEPPTVAISAPANGANYTAPANVVVTADAFDPDGTVASVSLYQNGSLLFQTAGPSASFPWNNVPAGAYTLTAVAADNAGANGTSAPVNISVTQSAAPVTVDFITFGDAWKYHDKGADLQTVWSQMNYDDSAWSNGVAQLGYGDGDEITRVEDNSTPGYNSSDVDRYITTYFRKAFSVTNATAFTNLSLRLLRDDAGVVYLNGQEIYRSPNMPFGAINYLTTTSQPNGENTIDTTSFAISNLFLEGTNVIAVEIHQQGPGSSDVSFDFSLTAIGSGETNARPLVAVSSPANGTLFAAPGNFTVTATASDSDGTITNVAFYVNGAKASDDTVSPYAFTTNNAPPGVYSLAAVATDNVGRSATSVVVTVTVSTNTAPPVVFGKVPAPGIVTALTNIAVTFSKAVVGLNASDLLVNGTPANGVTGSGSNYTFNVAQPSFGSVSVSWAAGHGISDLFSPPHAFNTNTPGANWTYQLVDGVPPTITAITPTPGSTIAALTSVAVTFSEPVTGVHASDLLINSTPALNVSGSGAGPYSFSFAQPPLGTVQVDWTASHGILDLSANAFAPAPWSYTLDTNTTGIIISEIMYHPSSENVLEEYIELFNTGPTDANLTGWKFTRGVAFTFPDVSIPPGGHLVVAADMAAFGSKYPFIDNVVGGWVGTLNNDGEEIELEDANGNRVDSVEYADEGDWAVRQRGFNDGGYRGWIWYKPHDGGGSSLELINPFLAHNGGQNWAASSTFNGTPGGINSVDANNVAPVILGATHFPIIPRATDAITFSARILDETAGGSAVNLNYRVSGAPSFTTVPMNDSGTNGDTVANDGIWSARLGAHANNTILEFYFHAVDAQNNARTWPGPAIGSPDGGAGPVGQVANALLQVDDAVYSVTNALPLYKVIMTAAENTELANIQSCTQSDAQMNATFISIDGAGVEHHYLTSIRNRGHGSRCAGNYRVSFRSDEAWKGLSAINLNVVAVPAQHFGSVLARKSGANGPAVHVAQVRINNVNRLNGPYAVVEDMNADFAEAHYPLDSGGNLYRAIRDAGPNFDYRGPNPSSYMNTYFKQNNVSENDWSDLIGMLNVMGTGNTIPFTTENVRQVVNVEQWIRHLAVMNLFGNSESGLNTGFNDDYMMYRGANDPRFELLFWDLDSVLGIGSLGTSSGLFTMTQGGGAGQALDRFVHWPDFELIYYRTLYELLTTTMSQTNFDALIDATLGPYVATGTINNMKNWMNGRRSFVLGQIPALPNTAAPTATVTGTPRSPTPLRHATFTVGGANVISYRFSLNGGVYGSETPVATPISFTLLPNGSNTLAVIGKGTNGVWQAMTNATTRGWIVNTSIPAVRLNEVLAQNNAALNHSGTFPDAIELFNEGTSPVDLGGLRLSDDNADPDKFTFAPNTFLAAGATLVVYANNSDGTAGIHLGFSLDVKGDSVHLFDRVANGNVALDSVKFGRQLADLSIGRLGNTGEWQLTQPTFGSSANTLQPLGSQNNLRINEWLAASLSEDDFVELYNANSLPAALGGLYLTDNLLGNPARNQIESPTFMGPGEFVAFTANGNGNGGDELNFSLALERGEIGLFSASLASLDCVMYGPQLPDVAQGRCPNGGSTYRTLAAPTPGAPNACTSQALPGGGVVINEVLANNSTLEEPDGSRPDWIELYNSSANAIDLSDMSLTDDSALPRRWVVPAGTILISGEYLKIRCDSDRPSSGTNTAFALKANGGSVFLFDKIANGSGLLSSIAYGLQAADFSIGRVPSGSTNWILNVPTLGAANIAATLGDPLQLRINEWMASPASGDDYFEIYNPNAQPVNISRFYLTDDLTARTKHQLPALSFIGVGPDAFQQFIADGTVSDGADHVNFSMRAQGEELGLTTLANVPVDDTSFGPQTEGVSQGRLPDGSATIVNFTTTPTPGRSNFRPLNNIFINELLSHSDAPFEDAVELHNPTDEPVDISGWYLSDSQNNLRKFRIPTNTVVAAGGHVVFYEYQFNDDLAPEPFSFSSARGDEVYLAQTISNALTGYRAFATFDAAENGVSFGRFQTSLGPDFTAMSARTFGADNPATTNEFRGGTGLSNAYPKVGPVVINELMYHQPGTNDALEFIELRNITAAAVPLYDVNNPSNTWRMRKGVDFNFPQGTSIPAGGYLVVVSFDPIANATARADFQNTYGSNMTVIGPYSGKLDNGGEAIELQKPDAPETLPGPDFGLVPYIVADRVVYSDLAPWPTTPDGSGDALKKVASTLYGNEPLNWQGGTPTPGAANFAVTSNSPPALAAIANRSVHVGYPVTFTASAIDSDLPAQVLLFSLDAPVPAGASINSGSGVFSWTPTTNQGPATYTITVRVTDNGSPSLSDSKTFQIAVLMLPQVTSVEITNGMVNITFESYAGRRYRVETTSNLANPQWVPIGADVLATGASSTLTLLGGTEAQRFYRVISYDN